MPNWCATTVVFYGEQANLEQLWADWNEALKDNSVKSDIGWLGKLLVYKGEEYKNIYCRGFLADVPHLEQGRLTVYSNDAWAPMFNFYNWVAECYQVEYVLIAEEPGCQVYINTDVEGKYFPERYFLDAYIIKDCKKMDELLTVLSELSDIKYFTDFSPIAKALTPYGVREERDMEKFCEYVYNKYPDVCFDFGKYLTD
jgi:hypothetical protein